MEVPDAGRIGFPAKLVGERGSATSLRPGSYITLKTVFNSRTGRTDLVGNGVRVSPLTATRIPPGNTVQLLVLSTSPQLRLKLIASIPEADLSNRNVPATTARHVLHTLGMQRMDGAEEIVRALIASHRELSPELIRALAFRIDRDLPDRKRRRHGRVLVELADKDMERDGEKRGTHEMMQVLTDGRWGESGGGNRDATDPDSPRAPSSISLRAFLQRGTSSPSHSLQLFNHLRGSGRLHWVVIPIGAGRADRSTTGTLRVGIDVTDHSVREASLALGVGPGVWWFYWEIESGAASLVSSEAEGGAPDIPQSLLARISGRGHTDTTLYQNGDGFSALSSEVQKLGVDEYG